jgi:hypothetical protein
VEAMIVDNTDTLYVLSFVNHGVWKYTGTGWLKVASNVSAISIAQDGSLVIN